MNIYQREMVIEVIEQLVAELGPHNVPAEIDVEGALSVLKEEEINGHEEERAETEVEES